MFSYVQDVAVKPAVQPSAPEVTAPKTEDVPAKGKAIILKASLLYRCLLCLLFCMFKFVVFDHVLLLERLLMP